jgi:DNA-binding XRE family transcriptional regulator
MTDDSPDFVAELRKWRGARGLSQAKLAQALKYDRSYISKVETGQEWPAVDFARRADQVLQAGGSLHHAYQHGRPSTAGYANGTTAELDGRFGSAQSGIVRFYGDFVDIEGDWDALFSVSSTLDLAIMYGATWRNTHRKRLTALAERADGRIRLVLPDPSPNSPVVDLYAHMLDMPSEEFRRKITEAIRDFQTIGPRRHVEIYVTSSVFRHAVYLFTHQAVLALYALCGERIATPAFLAADGELLSFLRTDFDRLLDHGTRLS